jgi:catechol 2,3-dioxygenase-like lactoylglutathione lyase family enzyme
MRYDGTMLITERLEECQRFYAVLLGSRPESGSGWARFALSDGSWIALHTPWRPGMTTTGGSQVVLLRVDSLDDEVKRLTEAGIACSEPHEIPGGAVVAITDPDDRTIQFIAYSGEG